MIYGIGIDIQDITKFNLTLDRGGNNFIERVFTEKEQLYANKMDYQQTLAGKWAAKEAFFKAIGTGIKSIQSLRDVEIVNLTNGKPFVILYGDLKDRFNEKDYKIDISISHSGNYAIGQIVISQSVNE